MNAVDARPGAWGVDLDTPLDAAACQRLRAAGASFAVRYLGDLTQAEAEIVTSSGLALMVVTHPRGGPVDADYGKLDGQHAVQRAQAAGIPTGATVFLDLEAWTGDGAGYVNAWSAVVKAAGLIPGLYVGAAGATPLTGPELYALASERYWRSISRVAVPEPCEFCLLQLRPGDVTLAGLLVDIDVVERDLEGRVPTWVVSSQDAPTMPGRKSSGSLPAVRG